MPFKNPHPLYSVWQGMKRRCYSPSAKQYSDYGGRGIKVCDSWKNSFPNVVNDMPKRPLGYSIERKNNDEDYSPENCVWATKKQQQRNRRITKTVTIDGTKYKAVELAEITSIKTDTILERVSRGLPITDILSPTKLVYLPGLKLGGQENGERKKALTHCKNGHEYTSQNTYITKEGWRNCRKCKAIKQLKRSRSKHE